MPTQQAGFNLVEMAIVLVIASFLMFSLFTPLAVRQENARIKETEDMLAEIKATLLGYAIVNQRLPCPDTEVDGPTNGLVTMTTATDCPADHEGELPWALLGMGQYDAWGQPFRYRLDHNYELGNTDAASFAAKLQDRQPAPQVLATNSGLEVVDVDDRLISSPNNSIVAIIFSCGKNREPNNENFSGANKNGTCANSSSAGNLNVPSIRYTQQKDVPKDGFDDILVWITQYELMSALLRSQQFPAD